MLNSTEELYPSKSITDHRPVFGKLEFSSLSRFMEDASEDHVHTVHLDIFEVAQQSELSFVYYVTVTVFVTAEDVEQRLLYEYAEDIDTVASTDRKCRDEQILDCAKQRIKEIEQVLRDEGFEVRHGRLTVGRRA
ncbi:hypothetical protein [Alicyclobacillus ferrooxydans]|uniref:Uncharacterized protein n=1 Tax=Alicyclobacillus ferrooxydans TaxID=471514 RepID=A0A0P9EHS5_9BACL|nr:hypothetical protein [Alicyclobacillus ferrooxydans]KPV42244.1 hypothetical protein AN477_18175 [Alicyclobacillus ferrooxydans]